MAYNTDRFFTKRAIILLCFFLSGAAGLIYQVAWAKSLTLIFGSTVYAVTIVLAVFLGGLALGSDLIGRWGERWQYPILLYALLELVVAALGALSLANLVSICAFTSTLFLGSKIRARCAGALRFLAVALVLFPIHVSDGGTSAGPCSRTWNTGNALRGRVSRLYWVNTSGAVAGALAAGFWLLPVTGGRRTVLTAAALNLLAGIVAFECVEEKGPLEPRPRGARDPETVAPRRLLLAAFAIVGATAMAYEIAWTRLLTIMFGNSTYAFTVMLGDVSRRHCAGQRVF